MTKNSCGAKLFYLPPLSELVLELFIEIIHITSDIKNILRFAIELN